MDNLLAQGKIVPFIVVMPNGHAGQRSAPGENSGGFTAAARSRANVGANAYEANFPEIINFVDRNYRTYTDRAHRAIAGLSMGGGHTNVISANYPEKFGYVAVMSASGNVRANDENPMLKDFDAKVAKLFSLKPYYYIAIGDEDSGFENNRKWRERLDSMGYKYHVTESDCGHVWKNWRHYLTEFSQALFK